MYIGMTVHGKLGVKDRRVKLKDVKDFSWDDFEHFSGLSEGGMTVNALMQMYAISTGQDRGNYGFMPDEMRKFVLSHWKDKP